MAGNSIRISTDQVLEIASQLESLNKKLTEELQRSKETVDHLANIWEGEASASTIDAYNEFASKFFQLYEDIINEYVKFLRANVAEGYDAAEAQNISIAEAFR